MAICHLPRVTRLRLILLDSSRTTSTLCKVCTTKPATDTVITHKPLKRSRSLNKEQTCVAIIPYAFGHATAASCAVQPCEVLQQENHTVTRSISVINLLSVLGRSTSLDLSSLLAYSRMVQKSAESSLMQYECLSKELNGPDLDHIFGIDRQLSHEPESVELLLREDNLVKEMCTHISDSRAQSTQPAQNSTHLNKSSEANISDTMVHVLQPVNNIGMSHILSSSGPSKSPKHNANPDDKNRPSVDELRLVHDHLTSYLPRCFSEKHNYRIYSPQVVFENNFAEKPFTTNGINAYVLEMVKYRMFAHFRYANVRMNILKSTMHEEDGSVRIRWRISGIPQSRAFMFWKFLPWKYNKAMNNESEWMDGFSIFYVQAKTGVIYKHKVDRVIADEDKATSVVKTVPLNVSGAA